MTLDALPEKTRELELTLAPLARDTANFAGCSKAQAHRDLREVGRYCLITEWADREALDSFLRSTPFSALLGSRVLLRSQPEVHIDAVVSREGMEAILTVRSGAD